MCRRGGSKAVTPCSDSVQTAGDRMHCRGNKLHPRHPPDGPKLRRLLLWLPWSSVDGLCASDLLCRGDADMCKSIYIHIYIYIHCMYMYMCIYIYIFVYVCSHYKPRRIYIYIHIYVHIHIYIYIYHRKKCAGAVGAKP